MYGFKGELDQKYGKPEGQAIYKSCKRLFALLPLAACICRNTLVLHGGLFRKPMPAVPSRVSRATFGVRLVMGNMRLTLASKEHVSMKQLELCNIFICFDFATIGILSIFPRGSHRL